jgi:hypothetical protein
VYLTVFKFFLLSFVIIFFYSCTNNNPISATSKTSENPSIAYVSSQTYLSSVPATYATKPSMTANLQYSGNLEMVRNASSSIEHLYWYPGLSSWVSTGTFGSNVEANPAICVLRSDFLLQVVALEYNGSGCLHHYWRDADGTWHNGGTFGSNCLGSPALLCGLDYPSHLEVVVRESNHLKHLWRDDDNVWHEESQFATSQTVIGDPQFVQTTDYKFHVIAPITVGSRTYMGYWQRVYSNDQYVWNYIGYFGGGNDINWSAGTALAVNYDDNTLEAIINVQTWSAVWKLFKYNGISWAEDGNLSPSTAQCLGATTCNNNEIHVGLKIIGGNGEHWKIIQ